MQPSTYHAGFEIWWLPVEYVHRFDALLNHAYSSIEEAHEVTVESRRRVDAHHHHSIELGEGSKESRQAM